MLSDFGKVFRIVFPFGRQKKALIGVSGGPDSLFLMDLLHRAGYPLVVAHLNHGLRSGAGEEARGVERMADTMGVEFVSEEKDVSAQAARHGQSLEEAARIARYEFLFRQAARYDAQAVAVGHNADDQVETVLMHILQGSGMAGLRGMSMVSLPNPWSQEIPLVRPLLSTWRKEIEQYCQERRLNPITDPSNADLRFARNRLRHELIPLLDEYNPGIQKRLWQMADILAADDDVLESLLGSIRDTVLLDRGEEFIVFDSLRIAKESLAMQRRLIRWAVSELRPDTRNLGYEAVERVIEYISAPQVDRQVEGALGVRVFREGARLYIATWDADADLPDVHWPQLEPDHQPQILELPGELDLGNGWHLVAEIVETGNQAWEQALKNDDPYRAWIDLGEQPARLKVRSRKPGDRFQPLGMDGGSVKISELMINHKISRRARELWPLICAGEKIVWVPGVQISHEFCLDDDSKRIVHLKLKRISE